MTSPMTTLSQPRGCFCFGKGGRFRKKSGRGRCKPVRWEVFWRVVIEGEPLSETAAALGLKYATAYAAARHVAKLLREEGRRRSARLGLDDSLGSEGDERR